MKRIYYMLVFLCLAPIFSIHSQTTLTVIAPSNANGNSTLRAPNGTSSHTSIRAHFLVSAAELSNIPNGTNLSKLGFELNNGATGGTASGNFKIYFENTSDATNNKSTDWVTAISSMSNNFTGTYPIPSTTAETNIDLTLNTPFTYTGGGVYIAYEYIGSTFGTVAANYKSNTDIPSALRMIAGTTTTPGATLSSTSSFRPMLRFSFPNPYSNEVQVLGMFPDKGKINGLTQGTQTVKAMIRNASAGNLSNVNVSLNITGANPFTSSQVIPSINAGDTLIVNFNAIPITANGNQTMQISVPNDDNNTNNVRSHLQSILCDTLGYNNNDVITGGVGFNTGGGILASRYNLPAGVPLRVTSVGAWIATGTASVGNQIRGVLCNSQGIVVDSTFTTIITNAMLGNRINLNFFGNADYAGQTVYVGIRQFANTTTGYFPFATQSNTMAPANAFYSLLNNGDTTSYTTLGVFMLEAVLKSEVNLASNISGAQVCPGTTVSYTAGSGFSNYNFSVDGQSQQSTSSGTYNFVPVNTQNVQVGATINTCTVQSNIKTIKSDIFRDSIIAQICSGDSYQVGTSTYTATGLYLDTLTAAGGCDSIIHLNLDVTTPGSSSITENICDGETYDFNGQILTTAGNYTATVQTPIGCDSVVNLTLTVSDPQDGAISATICQGEFYTLNGTDFGQTGVYTEVFQTSEGCDSNVVLTLTVTPLDITVTVSGNILTSNASSGIQWYDCGNNSTIAGATGSSYTATTNGQYAAIITNGNCVDTSECMVINVNGLETNNLPGFELYPNPASEVINLKFPTGHTGELKVLDTRGKVMYSIENTDSKELKIDVQHWAKGLYFIHWESSINNTKAAFVKQ